MTEEEFFIAWGDQHRKAARCEGWNLHQDPPHYVAVLSAWIDSSKVHYAVVYGQQLHHAAARGLLKRSPRWPQIVRNALEYRLQHDAPKESLMTNQEAFDTALFKLREQGVRSVWGERQAGRSACTAAPTESSAPWGT